MTKLEAKIEQNFGIYEKEIVTRMIVRGAIDLSRSSKCMLGLCPLLYTESHH